jgi:hypothetical protein
MGISMQVKGLTPMHNIMNWLAAKKFKYSIDSLRTNAIHGVYYLNFDSEEEELITKIAWGIV